MLDGFDIRLSFAADGKVETVSYADGDGCGHEALFSDPNTKLRDVVDYHLAHYKRSHRIEPTRMCGYSLPMPGNDKVHFVCNRDPHIGDDHELVKKLKR